MEIIKSISCGTLSIYLALLTLIFYLVMGIEAFAGARTLRFLKESPPLEGGEPPRISVIVAARNEKKNIEMALQFLLNQDYPNLEMMVIDDRSTDGTSDILDRLAQKSTRLKVVHITELPAGWLGKNYALYQGAMRASGDYLLFMDADVLMEASTLSRTLGYMTEKNLDHVTVFPELCLKGVLLNMVVGAFSVLFLLFTKPWQAKNSASRKHIGIGAFNLVRARAYREAGSHQAIAMRPDDDMKLAKLIKMRGFRQDCLLGKGMVSVEWYSSVLELINGLKKNSFAFVDYKVSAVIGATAVNLLFFVWPFFSVFIASGITQLIDGVILTVLALFYFSNARLQGFKPWYGFGFPLANLIFIYILWLSTLTTILNRGIYWRETYYSLDKLKANKI
ncbi:MAG: glycosyltransferase family 2 protein [Nitrospiria bacterium]